MDIKMKTVDMGFSKAYDYLERNPEENLPKLLSMIEKLMPQKEFQNKYRLFREALEDKQSPWHKLILSLWSDIDSDVRKTAFRNFIVNAFF